MIIHTHCTVGLYFTLTTSEQPFGSGGGDSGVDDDVITEHSHAIQAKYSMLAFMNRTSVLVIGEILDLSMRGEFPCVCVVSQDKTPLQSIQSCATHNPPFYDNVRETTTETERKGGGERDIVLITER